MIQAVNTKKHRLSIPTSLICISVYYFGAISLTNALAYNQNACKSLWRFSHAKIADRKFQLDSMKAINIFLTADMLFGALSGPIHDRFGAFVSHWLGYITYILGLILTMLPIKYLYWGMLLQGLSIQAMIYPPLTYASCFGAHENYFVSLIYAAPDLSAVVYAVGVILVKRGIADVKTYLWFLLIITILISIASHFILVALKKISQSTLSTIDLEAEQQVYHRIDSAPTQRPLSVLQDSKDEKMSLLDPKSSIMNQFSPKAEHHDDIIDKKRSYLNLVLEKTLTLECFCLIFVGAFCIVQSNIFMTSTEAITYAYGDKDHFVAQALGQLLILNAVACMAFAFLSRRLSVTWLFIIMLSAGVITNAIALIPSLKLQYLAGITYAVSKGAIFSMCTIYIFEQFGSELMGFMTGLIMFVSGVLNQIVGIYLTRLTLDSFREWRLVLISCIITSVIVFIAAFTMHYRYVKKAKHCIDN